MNVHSTLNETGPPVPLLTLEEFALCEAFFELMQHPTIADLVIDLTQLVQQANGVAATNGLIREAREFLAEHFNDPERDNKAKQNALVILGRLGLNQNTRQLLASQAGLEI